MRALLTEGAASITVLDDLSSGHEWLVPRDERVHFVEGDVCEIERLNLPSDFDVAFHLAALFANQNSVDHPDKDLRTNGHGTLSALMWASERGAKRFVYASAGCSIAGHGLSIPIREDLPVSLDLDTPYQITKALGEFYCNYFHRRSDARRLDTVSCRFFNSYGPGEVPGRYRNVIPNFVIRALRDEPLIITGTGNESRDFIYVDDLVAGLIAAATKDAAPGEAINLGTGRSTPIRSLAEIIISACGSRSRIEYAPRRPWDKSEFRQADISKARRLLGFEPGVEIEEGIDRTVSWFRENIDRIAASC